MFSLSELKQTRFYQEAKEEGRLEGRQKGRLEGILKTVPYMLSSGATIEQIAETFGLELEAVRKAAQQPPSSN
jgi:predicted transposase/invertase (TIGR01784 family)